MLRYTALLALLVVGCDSSEDTDDSDAVGSTPICDGQQQTEETSVDGPFDVDGDGYFDASNPDCVAAWPASQLDCDDADPAVNPAGLELPCNDIDDDCNPASEDNRDADGDGVGVCTDCNDATDLVFPGAEEICFDDVDNDCDNIEDNDCGENYNGIWDMTEMVDHSCSLLGIPVYEMVFDELLVVWNPPFLSISSAASGTPGAMDGTVEPDGSFIVSRSSGGALGTCAETFSLEGTFTSADTMEGVFTYQLNATLPGACSGCGVPATSVEFTSTKQ